VELEDRLPIIVTPPHLTWSPKGLLEMEWFRLEEHRKRVRGYERIPGHDEPHTLRAPMNASQECVRNHKLRGSMKARQECVRPRAGKDRVCILYNAVMSIYPGVSQIYTPRR